ncbi:hypothetical protein D9615_009953 [Tricholomella constricta]|uniref:Antifreeze protein n=1 Tax=Tricholomella constricta TaxID=117010 RepID=A0A8H5LT87_9AGAR|nr:hypothetical protein D9615_009953 [Tricholomella constricta]
MYSLNRTLVFAAVLVSGLGAIASPDIKASGGSLAARGTLIFCDKVNPCNKNGCAGINNPDNTGYGTCTANYKGCDCSNVCGSAVNPCDDHGCSGSSKQDGSDSTCEAGDYRGCYCKSTCNDSINSCSANGCAGSNGHCTAGKYKGCECN